MVEHVAGLLPEHPVESPSDSTYNMARLKDHEHPASHRNLRGVARHAAYAVARRPGTETPADGGKHVSRSCGRRSIAGFSGGRRSVRTWPRPRPCSASAICTSRTSAPGGTPRAGWSGVSTTSTKPVRCHIRTTSCGWPPAPSWRLGRTIWPLTRTTPARRSWKATARRSSRAAARWSWPNATRG